MGIYLSKLAAMGLHGESHPREQGFASLRGEARGMTMYDKTQPLRPVGRSSGQPTDAQTPVTPSLTAGAYTLGEQIGEGGFGNVFRAVHPVMQRDVAIKILNRRFVDEPEIVERFIREARAVCAIGSDDVVQIYDFGALDDGRHYFVMELLEGETLYARMQREERIAPGVVADLLQPVARAIDAAHAVGVIHRDIKPGNVFLQAATGTTTRTRLLDFGIALLDTPSDDARLTQTGHTVGTPTYMAPEQALGRNVTGAADVYALGVMAFEMLTGAPPFQRASFHELQAAHIHQPFPDAHTRNSALATTVSDVLRWMCAKDPSDRPRTAAAAVNDLGRALKGQRPQHMPRMRRSPARSRRWWAGVSAACAIVLGIGVVALADPADDGAGAVPGGETMMPPQVLPKDAPAATATLTETVTLDFELVPASARVVDNDGLTLLHGSGRLSITKGQAPLALRVQAPGYQSYALRLIPDRAQQIPVELTMKEKQEQSPDPVSRRPTVPAPKEEVVRGPNDIEPF